MQSSKIMRHIGLSRKDIGGYVFLPGSPERAEKISKKFENPESVGYHREFRSFTGTLDGIRVTVCSTGMGCPSTAIAVEELCELGAHTLIRVGSCASTSPRVSIGDIVIPNAAVRMEGVADHYVPVEFPPVPDMELVAYLEQAAKELSYPYNIAPTIAKASFYTQMAAETKPYGYELAERWKSYEKGGATSTEMESSTLFVIGEWLKRRTATVLVSATNYKSYSNDSSKNGPSEWEERAIQVGILAMRKIIADDLSAGWHRG